MRYVEGRMKLVEERGRKEGEGGKRRGGEEGGWR